MNATNSTPPTLLSIAPSKPEPTPRVEEGFADELSSAASRVEPKDEPTESTDTGTDESSAAEPSEHDADPATGETSAVNEEPDASDDPPSAQADADALSETELLSVAIVTETLVVETPPTAQLPEEAATLVDVTLEGTATTAPISPVTTGAEGVVPTPAVETSADANGPATPVPTAEDPEAIAPVSDEPGDNTDEHSGNQQTFIEESVESSEGESATERGTSEAGESSTTEAPLATATDYSLATNKPTAGITPPEESGNEAGARESKPQPTTALREAAPVPAPKPHGVPGEDATQSTASIDATTEAPSTATASERTASVAKPATGTTEGPPSVDPARFVSRVARAFDFAQERGGGPIEMRLSPPELGSLQVKIELKEGVLTAALEAETPAARQTLLDNLPALKDRLEQQQIRIEKFDVDVRDDSQQRGGDWQPSGDPSEQGSQDRNESSARDQEAASIDDSTATTNARSTIDFGSDEINLVA